MATEAKASLISQRSISDAFKPAFCKAFFAAGPGPVSMKDLDISHEITNVNGGAIAMGHPLGATGAMLVSTMLDELERRGLKRCMLSLCVGGGMGISTIIERV